MLNVRWMGLLGLVMVAACGGAASSSPASPGSSATTLSPSVSAGPPASLPEASEPSPSASTSLSGEPSPSTSEAPGIGMVPRPMGSLDGAPLGYLEHLPDDGGTTDARPLLVFLHGSGEAGDGSSEALELVDDLGIPPLIADGTWREDLPFIVLAPQYPVARAEGDCAIASELEAFLTFASQHYDVDPTRVYLTGISCGAIGIWDYVASHGSEVVAAAVPISGHAEWALEKAGCDLAATPPIWVFHGALDDVVPVVHIEGPIDRIRACEGASSAELELTVYDDADHDAWTRTYDGSAGHDIYAWLLEHQRD